MRTQLLLPLYLPTDSVHNTNTLHAVLHRPQPVVHNTNTLHAVLHAVTLVHDDPVPADFYLGLAPNPPAVLLGVEAPAMLAYLPRYYP